MALFPAFINAGGEEFPYLGKVIRRDGSTAAVTISNLAAGTYAMTQYGCVAFVDRNLLASKSGAAGFAIIHPDGTHQDNVQTQTSVSKGDILLWGNNCGVTIAEPS